MLNLSEQSKYKCTHNCFSRNIPLWQDAKREISLFWTFKYSLSCNPDFTPTPSWSSPSVAKKSKMAREWPCVLSNRDHLHSDKFISVCLVWSLEFWKYVTQLFSTIYWFVMTLKGWLLYKVKSQNLCCSVYPRFQIFCILTAI